MANCTVALTRCADYQRPNVSQAVQRQFDLLGGLNKFVEKGDSVLLKPNLIAPKSPRRAVQTDPAIILEVAKLLKDLGARPFVGDSPAWGNTSGCIRALKLQEPLSHLGVPVKQLNKPKKCKIGKNKIGISSVVLDADVIFNLPKFKSHQQLVTTFAIKNIFGCVSGKQKAFLHFAKGKRQDDFCQMLIDIFEFLRPAITIIDAVVAMEGPGPIRGTPKKLGWLIGGVEPVSCEITCCKLINLDPHHVPIIETARKAGFGCEDINKIELLGDDPTDGICTDFKLPELIPLRFSLGRVCTSICKQVTLLTKIAAKTHHRAKKEKAL